jgi:SAM-dependent methyltransferase
MADAADESAARRFILEHAHYTEDLTFWRQAARASAERGLPVLDLGAAAGRIALPLARDGVEVWAVDGSAAMVAEMRRRLLGEPSAVAARLHPLQADIRALALPERGRFGVAMLAMNTLQALLTPGDQLAALGAAREHLAPDGELIFDVALPDLVEVGATIGVVRQTGLHEDPARGLTLAHSAWYESFEPITQTLRFTVQIDEHGPDGTVRRHLRRHTVHLFLPSELRHLLARAGLEVVEAYGDFEGAPVEAGTQRQIYRCRAARQ